MASREEKLAAARKKLRAYIGQTRENDGARVEINSNASSPSPNSTLNDVQQRSETPVDRARIAWERRETLSIEDADISQHLGYTPENIEYQASSFPDAVSSNEPYRTSEALQRPASITNPFQSDVIAPGQPDIQSYIQREEQLLEQLRRQGQAINVIVTERNDAQAALSRVQAQLHEKSDALEDTKHKHIAVVQRLRELEENLPHKSHAQSNSTEDEKRRQELEVAQQRVCILEDQLTELKQKLEGKKAECESLSQDVRQLRNDLSVADIRIQQLSVNETSVSNIRVEELEAQKKELESRVGLLERRLQAAAVEGEQAGHRFHMYAEQCTTQITTLRNQVRDLMESNAEVNSKNEALARKIAELEESIAAAKNTEGPLESRIAELLKANGDLLNILTEKEGEISALQAACSESGERLAALQNELQDVVENKRHLQAQADVGHADPALLAAMESDKVAASRAVSQNQKLKEQLNELETAYVRVTNEKSELIDKLTSQEHENKELRRQLEGYQEEQLVHRHSDHGHDNKQSQSEHDDDHHHHKQSHSEHDHHHEHNHSEHGHHHEHSKCENGHSHHEDDLDSDEELDVDAMRHQMSMLRKDKTELMLRLQALSSGSQPRHGNHENHHSHSHNDDHHDHSHDCDHDQEKDTSVSIEQVEELKRAVKQLQEDKAELMRRLGAPPEDEEVQGLLEEKLRKTMSEIASLDEEKQRLEHLVLQLQGETETIGEYISLYQKQRQLLKKRSLEKDEQLEQLTRDREELKEKLASLNQLVQKFIERDGTPESQALTVEEATAERIRSLIAEIENNNVISHRHGVEHCFCCSGQLQTV